MSSWDPIDDLFNDNEPAISDNKSSFKSDNKLFNEEELDQNELLGIDEEPQNFDDYDDDFGLVEQKPTNTQPEVKVHVSEGSLDKQETHINDQKPKTDFYRQQSVHDAQTNEIFEEIENFQCDANVYNDEGLDYDNLLDYGEDDFEIKETKEPVQEEIKKIEPEIETKPVEPIKPIEIVTAKKSSPEKEIVQQPRPLMEETVTVVPLAIKSNPASENTKQMANTSLIHPDDLEEDIDDEEEDEDGVRKKISRSNHWSERGQNNSNNDGLVKSPVNGQNNNIRKNININNNGQYRNNRPNNMRLNNRNSHQQNFNNNNGNNNFHNSPNKFPQQNNNNCFPMQQNNFPMGPQNFSNQQNFNKSTQNLMQQPQMQNFNQNQRGFLNQVSPMTQGLVGPSPLLPMNQMNGNFQMNQQKNINNLPLKNDAMIPPLIAQSPFNSNMIQQQQQQINNNIRRDGSIMPQQRPVFIPNQNFNNQQIRPISNNSPTKNRMNFNPNQNNSNNFIKQNGYINPRTDLPMQPQMNIPSHQMSPVLNSFNNNQSMNKSPNKYQNGPLNHLSNQTSPLNNQKGLLPTPMPQQKNNFQQFPNQIFNQSQPQVSQNQFPANQFVPNMPNPNPKQTPSVPYNNSQLAMPPPTKPSTVYINPTFIAKQNKLVEQQGQNVLKDSNGLKSDSDKKQSDPKPVAKQRSRKDLEALLEKRLAAEILLSTENEKAKLSSAVSMSTKRKSFENSNNRHTEKSDSKAIKRSLSSSTNHRSESRSSSSKQIKPLMDEEPPIKKLMSKVVPNTTEKSDKPAAVFEDPEYTKKIEEQKRKREEILKMKEQKRTQRIKEAAGELSTPTTQIVPIKSRVKSPEKKEPQQTNIRNVIVTSETLTSDLKAAAAPKAKRIIKPKAPALTSSNVKQLINKTIQENGATMPKQRVMIHNLGANTTEKNLVNMCTANNLKEKVKLKIID